MRTICKLISIARGTCKFWTHRTSSSVRCQTIAWKYAYNNLVLHSRNPTHSVVMHVKSSACHRSSRIDYWTLNSCNVNSMTGWSTRYLSLLWVKAYTQLPKAQDHCCSPLFPLTQEALGIAYKNKLPITLLSKVNCLLFPKEVMCWTWSSSTPSAYCLGTVLVLQGK